MSASTCPTPRRRHGLVDVLAYTVHPRGTCDTAESLADSLDAECRAHEATRQALADAQAELAHLRSVADAARAVLAVTDTPTTFAEQDAHLGRLGDELHGLRDALQAPPASSSTPDAELRAAVAPFLLVARDRLRRHSAEPIPAEACRRFLRAFGELLADTDKPLAPPEAFRHEAGLDAGALADEPEVHHG